VNRRRFLALIGLGSVGLALPPLPIPAPHPVLAAARAQAGISMRFVKQWERAAPVTRLDVLYGMATVRPDLACRVVG